MFKVFSGRPLLGSLGARGALLLPLVVVNAAAVSVAILQCCKLLEGSPYKAWVPPRPATAAEAVPPGTPATDFTLPLVGGGQAVRLADLRRGGKPVVLIFSSFTCDFFTSHLHFLKGLYRDYRDRAEFLTVVVREARHPLPGLEFLLTTPADHEQRHRLVAQAMAIREWDIPSVLDTEDARTEMAYKAFPLRLVIVSPGGQIAFASRFLPGVFGLDRNGVTRWLEDHLGTATSPEDSSSPVISSHPAGM